MTAILADQLAVPSNTADSAWSMESMWVSGSTLNITLCVFRSGVKREGNRKRREEKKKKD